MKIDMTNNHKSKFGKASLKDKNLGRSPHRSTDQVQNNNAATSVYVKRKKANLNSHIPIQGYISQVNESNDGSHLGISDEPIESQKSTTHKSKLLNEFKLSFNVSPLQIDLNQLQNEHNQSLLLPLQSPDGLGMNETLTLPQFDTLKPFNTTQNSFRQSKEPQNQKGSRRSSRNDSSIKQLIANNGDSSEKKSKVPKTYQDWRNQEIQRMKEKQLQSLPNVQLNRERKHRIENIKSKIREDALSKSQINEANTLENGLRQKLSRLHQITVQEEPFTYSLSKVHDRTFIHKILPCIQNQQLKHSPIGASNSKSPNLLRNTFSVEMYAEFLKFKSQQQQKLKNEKRKQEELDQLNSTNDRLELAKRITISTPDQLLNLKKQSTPKGLKDDLKILEKDQAKRTSRASSRRRNKDLKLPQVQKSLEPTVSPRNGGNSKDRKESRRHSQAKSEISSLLSAIGMNFKEKMDFMMQKRKEEEKKQQMLEQVKKKKAQGGQLDMDFFTQLEQKDMDNRLIEIIMFEINKMFSKEMLKYRNVTSEYNSMLKRKNLLEAKLFKKRYEKVQKHLNGVPNMDSSLNPFKRPYQPSIFNNKMADNKMDVPNNKELYENVIKEAFDDLADTDQDETNAEVLQEMDDKEIIERIRMKFRKRVIKEGPSIMNSATDQNTRFLEQMMNLCNFQRISTKIQGGINKFQRSHRLKNKSMSYNTSPRPEQYSNEDLENTKSTFFITQSFIPNMPNSHRQTPSKQYHSSRFKTLHDQSNQSSPNVTTYLNYLASNHNVSNKKISDYSTIQLNSNRSLNAQSTSRYGASNNKSKKYLQTINPFQQKNSPTSRTLLRQVSKSTDLSPIITEVEKEIQIKDDIKERARAKTLSNKDWEQIGQSRILQFTVLDRIIEDCADYDRTNQEKLTKLTLGLNKNDSIELAKHHRTMVNSRDNFNKDTKKKNIEDTLTFLEKLKKMNKLSQVEKLNFE